MEPTNGLENNLVFTLHLLRRTKHSDIFDNSDESFFILPFGRHHNKKDVPSVVEVEVGDSDEDESSSFFPTYFRPLFFNPFSFMNFGFSDFFSKPSFMDSLVPKGIPDAAVKNSTSTTKVVDGHKIVVNDTVYENEKNGAVYRIQVVEILPTDSQETPNQKGSDEKTDKSSEEKTEEKHEVTSTEGQETKVTATEEVKPDQNSEDNEINREEILTFNPHYEFQDTKRHISKRDSGDLSGDIRVNRLASENARRGGLFMIPPEVEVFDSVNYDQVSDKYQQQEIIDPYENQAIVKPKF
ncbi:hypothetical protein RUM43_009722 [Polyplax serrata]|uniref:Uncharacterized protein n=1 Tax=Polyplax serrata TaxID=468196 RepID=A0AAN8S9U9_POLSC